MHRVDYELGLLKSADDYSSADGRGAAKAALVACNGKCVVRHPFNKGKRLDCKERCAAAYQAKVSTINAQTSGSQGIAVGSSVPSKLPANYQESVRGAATSNNKGAGLSTGAKIGIGVGVLAIVGVGIYLMTRK